MLTCSIWTSCPQLPPASFSRARLARPIQTPTALCLQVWAYTKKQTVAWFNIMWQLQRQINSLTILQTHWCPALGSSPQLGTSFTAVLPPRLQAELYLLHWLDFQKSRTSLHVYLNCVPTNCRVYSQTYSMCLFPNVKSLIASKKSTTIHVPKKSTASCINDYRPVALTSVVN